MSKRNEYLNKQEKECLYKQFKEIHDKIDFKNSCFTFMETKYNYAGYLHSAILSVGDFDIGKTAISMNHTSNT